MAFPSLPPLLRAAVLGSVLAGAGCAGPARRADVSVPSGATAVPEPRGTDAARAEAGAARNSAREAAAMLAPAEGSSAAAVEAASDAGEYGTPIVDGAELAGLARAACERAQSAGKPVLLEFSAPWCEDCKALARVKVVPPLRDELARWEHLAVNVGDGFQHPELMRAFRVEAIAKLVAASPPRCDAPLAAWRPRGARTLHGVAKDPALAEKLSASLSQLRGSLEAASVVRP